MRLVLVCRAQKVFGFGLFMVLGFQGLCRLRSLGFTAFRLSQKVSWYQLEGFYGLGVSASRLQAFRVYDSGFDCYMLGCKGLDFRV